MNKFFVLALSALTPLCLYVSAVRAQEVVPDTSLPNNSVVDTTGDLAEITGGYVKGSNLFHSFQTFNLEATDTAFFNNGADISNILGRVTGGTASSIDGLIQANGDANLFLINPNGIVFGENAALDVGGTFTAATADSITFEDGVFSAVNPGESILSVSLPTGAQLGSEAPPVTVFGRGSIVYWDDFAETIYNDRPDGLSSANGITLIGGGININGGNVTSEEGTISLVAASNGSIEFGNLTSVLDSGAELGNINVTNEASASTTGEGSGTINLVGGNAFILDGSSLLSQNYGEGESGSINIDLTGDLEILGENGFGDFPSYVSTDVLFDGISKGGDININTGNASALLGGQVNAATFGEGAGGNVNINATGKVYASSGGTITSSSFLIDSAGPADAGELNIDADLITVEAGGHIGSTAFDVGSGGTVNLNAREISVLDREDLGDGLVFPSQITNNALFDGNAGDININTDVLTVLDGAQVLSFTEGFGAAGNININAGTIDIAETYPNETGVDTGIVSGSGNEFPTEELLGTGGNISIVSEDINLVDGGLISSGTFTGSSGGNIQIETNNLNLSSDPQTDTINAGGLITNAARSIGDAGSITVNANNVEVTGGGQISVSSVADGNAGNLEVNTGNLRVEGFTEDVGSSALLSTAITGSGDAGNVTVNADNVEVRGGGTISASNFSTRNPDLVSGTGAAGNININTRTLTVANEEPTSISAAANEGGGGAVTINAAENVTINGSEASITAETLGSSDGGVVSINSPELNLNQGSVASSATSTGNAGNINLNADELNSDGGSVVAESQVAGGGDVNINSDTISLDNGSLISTSVQESDGGGGNITINNSDFILAQNDSDIRANAEFGPGGNIAIATNLFFRDLTSEVDASSNFGLDGVVEIDRGVDEEIEGEPISEEVEDPSKLITSICPVGDDNVFAVTGRGGIPQQLQGNLSSSSTTEVIGTPQASKPVTVQGVTQASTSPIKEATGFYTASNGETIIAHSSTAKNLGKPWYNVASCSK